MQWGNLATAVHLNGRGHLRRSRARAGRQRNDCSLARSSARQSWESQTRCGVGWGRLNKLICCSGQQAVWRWLGPSFLDGGVPLPSVVRPGPSAERGDHGRTGPERRASDNSSEPPRHLPRCPVWELLLPGQLNTVSVVFKTLPRRTASSCLSPHPPTPTVLSSCQRPLGRF